MKVNEIRSLLLKKFGKRSTSKWYKALLDIVIVDFGIKDILLFDCWSVSSCEMNNFLQSAKVMNLLNNHLSAFSFGMDVFLYNKSAVKHLKNNLFNTPEFQQYVIDISKPLNHPKLLTINCKEAKETVALFSSSIGRITSELEELLHDVEIDADDARINPPCLFGLLLGYPAVYWYDRTVSEDNCLLTEHLYLYQVIGEVEPEIINSDTDLSKSLSPNKRNSSVRYLEKTCHTVLSFTIPTIINEKIKSDIKLWFIEWKRSVPWSSVFAKISLEEKIVEPQAVCL